MDRACDLKYPCMNMQNIIIYKMNVYDEVLFADKEQWISSGNGTNMKNIMRRSQRRKWINVQSDKNWNNELESKLIFVKFYM